MATLGLLPSGRAWQTHVDMAPAETITAADADQLTVQQQYWMAFSDVLAQLHERACLLINEFFCSTIAETRPEWEAEYGFPDDCEGYDNLCQKVTAIGGTTCGYYTSVAAERGWALLCREVLPRQRLGCRPRLGCGRNPMAAGSDTPLLSMVVVIDQSPSYGVDRVRLGSGARIGALRGLGCGPSLDSLVCLLDRIRPADVPIIVTTIDTITAGWSDLSGFSDTTGFH